MKVFGVLLIITSSVISSHFYEKRFKYILSELKEIEKFVVYISNQIEHFSLSLHEIYKRYNVSGGSVLLLTQKKQVVDLGDDVQEALAECFERLGSGFKDEEIKRLTLLDSFLLSKIQEQESVYAEKTRVFRTIAFFIGFSLVILLV